ncbi:MAG: hypothetical protein Q8O92_01155 [Candidatus Latescibacter sp.]|nr:hypothetical protein [Candidatus Latescibacter sp.]
MNEIRAKQFTLVDEKGSMVTMLRVSDNGPDFGMADFNGKLRAILSVSKDGPSLSLFDGEGKAVGKMP